MMPKKKKKKKVEVIMHQHRDQFGTKFGASHPIDAEHKNPKTQKFHELTVKRA
jgi:hypothetical protein